MTSTSFHIETAKGVCVMTFASASAAKEYCLRMKAVVPGLSVVEVQTTTTRRTIYKPRMSAAA